MLPAIAAGTGENPSGDPPSAAPLRANLYYYAGGKKVGVSWRNGDVTASTQVAYGVGSPDNLVGISSPGETARDLGIITATWESNAYSAYVRHVKNGQYSDWTAADEAA